MCLPVAATTVFPNFLKFWSPPHDLALSLIVWILEPRALILDGFLKIQFSSWFLEIARVWNCCRLHILELVLLS